MSRERDAEAGHATSGTSSERVTDARHAPPREPQPPGPWARIRARLHAMHVWLHRNPISGAITKVVVTVIGLAVLGGGLVMMVTPGPGIVGIILGLGILALEWTFAERWVQSARRHAHNAAERARNLDPAVRRRRIALTVSAAVVVVGAISGYVLLYDWPPWANGGWNIVQDLAGFVPELPGMEPGD